ncbi:MFS transporter [Caballeronia sp. 15715]|uniref:MFS transporter n=1 Tax=Caballeronia sp. 15715 TaxID=3391030 RepID=UPI0039E388F7
MAKIGTERDDRSSAISGNREGEALPSQLVSKRIAESETLARRLPGRKLRMLLCCAGAPFLIMLDSNIVAVSLPSIARDLHGEFTDVEWVVSAYILPFAALLIPAGALADRLGRRRMLLLGLSIFTLASLLCGLAPSLVVLNGARALQAVGAALQLSAALAVITHGFQAQERARVYAILGTVMGIAPSLGPLVGGLVTSYLGWRWAFLINVPIGASLVTLIVFSVDESRDPNAGRLDLPGIFLFGTGLFSIVWALIAANSIGWGSTSTYSKLVVGALLLIAFFFAERMHPRPMVDLSIFRDRTVVGAAIAMFGYAAAAQVMMTLLPLYLQDMFSYSPAIAGLAMIPFALPLLVGPSIGGRLSLRVTSRAILVFGLGLVATGNAFIAATILAGCGYWAAAIGMVITGSGAGLLNGETTKAQISAVRPERAGMASGIAGATRFVGIIVGLAGMGAVLAGVAESSLHSLGLPRVHGRAIEWHALSLRIMGGDANGALSALPAETRESIEHAVRSSVAHGFGAALAVGAIVAAVSSALSWLLIRRVDPCEAESV